jgi:tRNA modification GTPase
VTADTIYALSSGSPPAGIAVVRISGPNADLALLRLARKLPPPRVATLAELRGPDGLPLDRALVLRFPGPASATGEDVAELHLHGGRAVVAAVMAALARVEGLRLAAAGEFTRRGFENGRMDLAEAEGLADLLAAETESQRRSALALAEGALSRRVAGWQARILALSASLEAAIDFSDEGEVAEGLPAAWADEAEAVAHEIEEALRRPHAERLRDGVRIVVAGPPNAGKSSLINALAGRDVAITSPVEGTTRDVLEAPVAIAGNPYLLVDTAGLRESDDAVERSGVERARRQLDSADLVVWLGPADAAPEPERSILVRSKCDIRPPDPAVELNVSAANGEGLERLLAVIVARAAELLPSESDVALNARHRRALTETLEGLEEAVASLDLLIRAEGLRLARSGLDRVTGRAGVEDMLDALFGAFCIGK